MEGPIKGGDLTVSFEEKLRYEISVLKTAIAKMERNSNNLNDQQAYTIYERILQRRIKLLNSLSA